MTEPQAAPQARAPDAGHRLGMGAVEAIGNPQNATQPADQAALIGGETREVHVRLLGKRPAVVSGHVGDQLDLVGGEPGRSPCMIRW